MPSTSDQASSSAGRLGNRRGRATRERLLRAATEAFAEKGFHATTTREIADRAGMSPSALYVHYPTKELLLFELSLTGHREALAVLSGAIDAHHPDPAPQLYAAVRDFTAWHARCHTTARVIQYEMAALTVGHRETVTVLRHALQDRIREVLDRGIADGTFALDDSRMPGLALLSLGIDVARWYRDEGEWTPDDIGRHYAALTENLVAKSDQA